MKGKISFAIIASMFIFILLLSFTKTANAQTATVTIDAPDDVELGTFQVKINITDVTGLYGWEFKLYFENDLLQYKSYSVTGHFLETGGSTFQVDKCNNAYNSTHGLVWLADSLLGAPSGVSGNGTLVTLTFNATSLGTANLVFEDQSAAMEGKNIKLGDKSANPIANLAYDKVTNVIPEFTSTMLLITLFAAAVTTALLTKKIRK